LIGFFKISDLLAFDIIIFQLPCVLFFQRFIVTQ
jgi:hypothetical protein